jgi:hypothetical protein
MKLCKQCITSSACKAQGKCLYPPATEELIARRSAAACSPRVLAARIATDLFTNAFGDQGTRLEIKQSNGPASERSLGGWCYVAAVDRIADIIEENATVDLPDTAAQDSASKSNSPAVSG